MTIYADIPNVSGIYSISYTSSTDSTKRYVGSSKHVKTRIREHFSSLARGTHCNHLLQNAYNKYGEDAFSVHLLKRVDDSLLLIEEQTYLDTEQYVLNISSVSHAPKPRSTEELRAAALELWARPDFRKMHSDRFAAMWNDPIKSENVRKKMSAAASNRTVSDQTRAKMSRARVGIPRSSGTRAKIAESKRGVPVSQLTCPHCKKTGGGSVMYRHHFDNCKRLT